MDAKSKAVMMAWERPLMKAHVRAVCQGGGKVLNVGFGMGFVDEAMHRYEPEEHTVVEAHPEVYERMLKLGWGEKKNIRIVFGRWQDMMPQLGSYEDARHIQHHAAHREAGRRRAAVWHEREGRSVRRGWRQDAEVIADVALYPMEVVKIRVQTQSKFARCLVNGLPKIV